MEQATKIWAVAAMAPKQEAEVKAHCFGDCGKISMAGAIMDEQCGALLVCCQESCPFVDEEIENFGQTMSFGKPHNVTLRILKREAAEQT